MFRWCGTAVDANDIKLADQVVFFILLGPPTSFQNTNSKTMKEIGWKIPNHNYACQLVTISWWGETKGEEKNVLPVCSSAKCRGFGYTSDRFAHDAPEGQARSCKRPCSHKRCCMWRNISSMLRVESHSHSTAFQFSKWSQNIVPLRSGIQDAFARTRWTVPWGGFMLITLLLKPLVFQQSEDWNSLDVYGVFAKTRTFPGFDLKVWWTPKKPPTAGNQNNRKS